MRTRFLLLLITWSLFFNVMSCFSQELFEAIKAGNLDKVIVLLKTDPNLLESKNEQTDTPLHFAVYTGKKDIVLYLLTQNAKIDKTNKGNATALLYSVFFGHKEIAEVLLAKGAECNIADLSGRTALHYAATSGKQEIVQLLVINGAEIDNSAKGYYGRTALHLALQNEHIDVAKYLINKGADLNKKEDAYGWSALYWALRRGRTDIAKELITMGADIHITDNEGNTPIRMAVNNGYGEVVDLLYKNGAALNEVEEHAKHTLLHSATINGYLNIVDLLIQEGSDVNVKDKYDKTPLFYAKKYGHNMLADLLMKNGAKSEFLKQTDREVDLLNKQIKKGEATIWYLGHCGWAIKTQKHFLIFDYWQYGEKPDEPSILNGHINPNEIKDSKVYVFVSHKHYDHFDSRIFEWRKTIKNIKYVLGWQMEKEQDYIYLNPNEKTNLDELKIITRSSWDGVENQGFIVNVDGVVIYHTGDDSKNDSLKFLSQNAKSLDLFFQVLSGDERDETALQRIKNFQPRITFPMHYGGREYRYKEFAKLAKESKIHSKIICTENRGDRFFYTDSNGLVK